MIDEKDLRRKKWNNRKNKRNQSTQKPIKPVKKKDRIKIDPTYYHEEDDSE